MFFVCVMKQHCKRIGLVRNLLMEKLDRIKDIKLKALYIERKVMNNRPEEMDAAEQELKTLRDRFCDENKDFITPPLARALRQDFNTFLVLIDWAYRYYEEKGV